MGNFKQKLGEGVTEIKERSSETIESGEQMTNEAEQISSILDGITLQDSEDVESIEGAAEGTGLGDKFLRHIERTKLIVHIVDMSGIEGRDPYQDYVTINKELEAFNKKILDSSKDNAAFIVSIISLTLSSSPLFTNSFILINNSAK